MKGVWLILSSFFVPYTLAAAAQPYYGGTVIKLPLSGAAWVPPDGQQADPPQKNEIADLKREIAEMRKDLARLIKLLEDGVGPPDVAREPDGRNSPDDALITALGTCAGCHAAPVAKKNGDGFVLFTVRKNGDRDESVFRDDFTRRELRSIEREISDGSMPKKSSGKKLSPEQNTALLSEIRARLKAIDGPN